MLSLCSQKSDSSAKARHRHSAGGFTITEVLVASLVLLISYIALTQSFVVMNRRAARLLARNSCVGQAIASNRRMARS